LPPNPEKKVASKQDPKHRTSQGLNSYAKYSGIAFQMIAILLLGVYAGKWVDTKIAADTPWGTLVGALIGIVLALYVPLRGLMK